MLKKIAIQLVTWVVIIFVLLFINAYLLMRGFQWSPALFVAELFIVAIIYRIIKSHQKQKSRQISSNNIVEFNHNREVIPPEVQKFVWQRDNGRCVKCGSQERLEYDHIIPVSKGGSNTARNIQLLCEHCNRTKSARIGE